FHPLRFQPGIHFVRALMTYWESQKTLRSSPLSAVDRSRSSTAMSSPRLFVAFFQPPACQQPSSMYQAHPAGPGFPSAEPSAAAMIVNGSPWKVGFHSFTITTVAVASGAVISTTPSAHRRTNAEAGTLIGCPASATLFAMSPRRRRAPDLGADCSDVESQRPHLFAAVLGDLLRTPWWQPDPVDPVGGHDPLEGLCRLILDDIGQRAGRRGQGHLDHGGAVVFDRDSVDQAEVDDVDTELGVDDVHHRFAHFVDAGILRCVYDFRHCPSPHELLVLG